MNERAEDFGVTFRLDVCGLYKVCGVSNDSCGCDAHGTYVRTNTDAYCIPAEIISIPPVKVTFLARNNVHILKELLEHLSNHWKEQMLERASYQQLPRE